MNETINAIFDRRSIRSFTAEPLAKEQINTLAEVAMASPSGMNLQPWLFHFVTDQARISAVSEAAVSFFRKTNNQAVIDRIASRHPSIFYGAPLVVFITTPKDNPSGVDVGIAVANLVIAAQSMGLGSCIIGMASAAFGSDQAADVARLLEVPDDRAFVVSIAIGHPAATKEAHERNPEKVKFL